MVGGGRERRGTTEERRFKRANYKTETMKSKSSKYFRRILPKITIDKILRSLTSARVIS